jgi:hypothetical protein
MMNATGKSAHASCFSEYGLHSSELRRFAEPRRKPILFADVQNTMAIAREEIFGPVLSIFAYVHENDAARIAPLWIGRVRDFGRPQAQAGFRGEFDRERSHQWPTVRFWQLFWSVQTVGQWSAMG